MTDMLDKMFNFGVGALVMTKEKAEDMVNELIKKGELGREEGKKMVQDLLDRGEQSRKSMRDELKKIVREVLAEQEVPARFDIDELRNELLVLRQSKPNEGELYQIRADIAQIKAKLNM